MKPSSSVPRRRRSRSASITKPTKRKMDVEKGVEGISSPVKRGSSSSSEYEQLVLHDLEEAAKPVEKEPNLTGEWSNIFTLMVLYTMQGIPLGLSAAVPLILNERGISYSDLGTFSLNSLPFSLKILWAPFVDALYISMFGRRKTWLIPVQVGIGLTMIAISSRLDEWMGKDGEFQIMPLTAVFFFLYFLCATQDIAVDGWALTMLRPENVGYASTCNSAGQITGYFLAFVGALALQQFNIASLAEFVQWNGFLFVFLTILVAILRKEPPVTAEESKEMESPSQIYQQIALCFRVPALRSIVLVLFLWKLPFAANDALSGLKVQQAGVSKEHMAFLGLLITPFQIFVPVILGKITAGKYPLNVIIHTYLPRVLMGPVALVMVHYAPEIHSGGPIPVGYYSALLFFSTIGTVMSSAFFCAQMAFFAKVSDKSIGGTYMTLLNTFANLGGMWTTTLVLKIVDFATLKECDADGNNCTVIRDGYTMFMLVSLVLGFLSFPWLKRTLHALQLREHSEWTISNFRKAT
eukprot:GEMP01031562.1.p1 GENE.GEMP01031562.1~~GEMP01031562.1.p1  ORF type:complete len:530 (+),score=94.51 GEMP01031562.1:24-1592(+)